MSKLAAANMLKSSIDASTVRIARFRSGGNLAIEGEHLGAEIDDRHFGARAPHRWLCLPPPRCQAKHAQSGNAVRQPAGAIDGRERIGKVGVVGRARESLRGCADQRVPGTAIVVGGRGRSEG